MKAIKTEAPVVRSEAAKWVENRCGVTLSAFQVECVDLLRRAFRAEPEALPIVWDRVQWEWGAAVIFPALCARLATFDSDALTRLVIGAHDNAIRVALYPRSANRQNIAMCPRGRRGADCERHPTIEEAVADFRSGGAS
jgi:hypothetical protein